MDDFSALNHSIPVLRSPSDMMVVGPNSDNLAAVAVEAHPIDRLQRSDPSASLDLDSIRRLYGSALAMRLTTERTLASKVGGRLPGFDAHPNSNTLLDSLTGNDESIEFKDFLNVPQVRAQNGTSGAHSGHGPHQLMERKLGL